MATAPPKKESKNDRQQTGKRALTPDAMDLSEKLLNLTSGLKVKRARFNVFKIKMSMHEEARQRLRRALRAGLQACSPAKLPTGIIVVHGGSELPLYDTDTTAGVFQQESNFHYLFGVKEPDCLGAIHMETGKSYLFIPRLPEDYQLWMGPLKSCAWFQEHYGIDSVHYVDEMRATLAALNPKTLAASSTVVASVLLPTLYGLRGVNTDSGRAVAEVTAGSDECQKQLKGFPLVLEGTVSLYDLLVELRTIKSAAEIELMRYVTNVTSDAHILLMRHCSPGLFEFQLESLFKHYCYYVGGCRHMAYTCICASGANGAVLHYGHAAAANTRQLKGGDMCLFDMGAEFHRYASDVTCSFPANGVFSKKQRVIYEAVLAAQWAVMDAMRPGVSWLAMHNTAYRVICIRLRACGLLRGDVEEMMAANVGSIFMMHGLGHFIGLNVHDVGGYTKTSPARPKRDGYRSLRTSRLLKVGMCLTVEPGIYFNEYVISRARKNAAQGKFLVQERLDEYAGFGGVRLEDVVLVTDSGIENLTNCPRTIEDVEAVMAGQIKDRRQLKHKFYLQGGFEAV